MALNISHAMENLKDDFNSADKLVDEIYSKYFATYFKRTFEFSEVFADKQNPITDDQLEDIIVGLPLDLIQVSASLSQFKQHHEIVKLTIKQRKKIKSDLVDNDDLNTEYALMAIVYSAVITRVESQISFSKELVMSAKKVWDARRHSEDAIPIRGYVDLPDYTPNSDVGGNFNGIL